MPGSRESRFDTRTVASAAVFTAFVAAATMAFSLSIPVTSGYFNIGEIMVYTAALLMGPYVGAFAGGVGSMISDLSLGFPSYAPGTLVIKGIEGFLVGYLSSVALKKQARLSWSTTTSTLATLVGVIVAVLGIFYLSGDYQLTLGFPLGPQGNVSFSVPSLFWVALGPSVTALILVVGFSLDEKLGWTTFSILVGGSEMILGYFLYESVVLQLGFVSAAGEVPFNIAQAVVGLLVSVPLVRSIRRVSGRTSQASQ